MATWLRSRSTTLEIIHIKHKLDLLIHLALSPYTTRHVWTLNGGRYDHPHPLPDTIKLAVLCTCKILPIILLFGRGRGGGVHPKLQIQDFGRIINHFRWIYIIYLKWIKQNVKMSICNQLDLETLGSGPIFSKNLPGWIWEISGWSSKKMILIYP